MADWQQLESITDPTQWMQQMANIMYGAPTTQPLTDQQLYSQLTTGTQKWGTEGWYTDWNQASTPFIKSTNPFSGDRSYMTYDEAMATKGTDVAMGVRELYTSPYTAFQNYATQYRADNPVYYSGQGLMSQLTGGNPASLGGGVQVTSDPAELARNLGQTASMDAPYLVWNRYGLPDSVFNKLLNTIQPYYSPQGFDIQSPEIGSGYDWRLNAMQQMEREKREGGGFMDNLMNQVTKFIPGISEARNIAEGTMNENWTPMDTFINTAKNVVAPYIQSSGDYVSRDIGRYVPAETEKYMRPLALSLGTYVFPGAGTAAANSIVNSVYGNYQRSPTTASIGSAVAGGTAYATSLLSELMSGLTADELTAMDQGGDWLENLSDEELDALLNKSDEMGIDILGKDQITPEQWEALYGANVNNPAGTFWGDLAKGYSDVATDVGNIGSFRPNAAEMEWIRAGVPPESVKTDYMTNLLNTDEGANLVEAERDTALRDIAGPKKPFYFKPVQYNLNQAGGSLEEPSYFNDAMNFNPETGDLEYNRNPEQPFTDAPESDQYMDQILENAMRESEGINWKEIMDRLTNKEVMNSIMKLLNSGQGATEGTEGYTSGWWGPNRRAMLGGGLDIGGYDANQRMKGFEKSNYGAGEADKEQWDISALLDPRLKDYFTWQAITTWGGEGDE